MGELLTPFRLSCRFEAHKGPIEDYATIQTRRTRQFVEAFVPGETNILILEDAEGSSKSQEWYDAGFRIHGSYLKALFYAIGVYELKRPPRIRELENSLSSIEDLKRGDSKFAYGVMTHEILDLLRPEGYKISVVFERGPRVPWIDDSTYDSTEDSRLLLDMRVHIDRRNKERILPQVVLAEKRARREKQATNGLLILGTLHLLFPQLLPKGLWPTTQISTDIDDILHPSLKQKITLRVKDTRISPEEWGIIVGYHKVMGLV